MSAITAQQAMKLSSRDQFAFQSDIADFLTGVATLIFNLSLEVLDPPAKPTMPVDAPKYVTGVFIVKSNGLPCWVHYRGNNQYELWDEWGNQSVVNPDAEGRFGAFGGIPGKFETNGEITWPGNRWLSHKQAETEAFSVYQNLGRPNETTIIRCHPEGLEMVDEHNNRTVAKFDPNSRAFTAWGMRGHIEPRGRIVWPNGGYWSPIEAIALLLK